MTAPFITPSIETERWEPPTMKSVQQIEGNPLVKCSCGRSVNADMMRPVGKAFVCDACQETQIRTGQLSREELARSLGAPDYVILKAQQLDASRDADTAAIAARGTARSEI